MLGVLTSMFLFDSKSFTISTCSLSTANVNGVS